MEFQRFFCVLVSKVYHNNHIYRILCCHNYTIEKQIKYYTKHLHSITKMSFFLLNEKKNHTHYTRIIIKKVRFTSIEKKGRLDREIYNENEKKNIIK